MADKAAGGTGDALNCGVNLARYRYVCAVDAEAPYTVDSLLEAMQAALEDPAVVVGVTTSLAVSPAQSATTALMGRAPTGLDRRGALPHRRAHATADRRADAT